MSGWSYVNSNPEIRKNKNCSLYIMLDGKRTFLKDACNLKGVNYNSVVTKSRRNQISLERSFNELANRGNMTGDR